MDCPNEKELSVRVLANLVRGLLEVTSKNKSGNFLWRRAMVLLILLPCFLKEENGQQSFLKVERETRGSTNTEPVEGWASSCSSIEAGVLQVCEAVLKQYGATEIEEEHCSDFEEKRKLILGERETVNIC